MTLASSLSATWVLTFCSLKPGFTTWVRSRTFWFCPITVLTFFLKLRFKLIISLRRNFFGGSSSSTHTVFCRIVQQKIYKFRQLSVDMSRGVLSKSDLLKSPLFKDHWAGRSGPQSLVTSVIIIYYARSINCWIISVLRYLNYSLDMDRKPLLPFGIEEADT